MHETTTGPIGHGARFWEKDEAGRVLCTLCPRLCRPGEGQAGFCFVRQNHRGELRSMGYGHLVGMSVDPMEKKPLYHFLPGSRILSFGTVGCNLGCKFCQNWDISRARAESFRTAALAPAEVVNLARHADCPAIAFTYNDPVIWAEYAMDVAALARPCGIDCVAVTAGYVSAEARGAFFRDVAAANVDLKAFSERFYSKLCLGHIEPVLDTLRYLVRETRVWVEITNLVIPGWNDDSSEIALMCDWILRELGPGVPLHFTAFHPAYRLTDVPPTSLQTLRSARKLAMEMGLRFVYTGNAWDPEGSATSCPDCSRVVVARDGMRVRRMDLVGGCCPECGHRVPGKWAAAAHPS
ncbi:MAG: AmmeMemoRadiSam system radical SAM enzyme [Acidobacteriota bacterium]